MKALVFGSLNIDYMYAVDHIVEKGETLDSASLTALPGGKGLNQAVALSKAGLDTAMAGLIGEDGAMLKKMLQNSGVNTEYVRTLQETTGHAIIQVAAGGANSIVLYGGTNRMVTEGFIDEVLAGFKEGDLILLQNEINKVDVIIEKAAAKGLKVALNPSPMNDALGAADLAKVDLLILNEIEGAQITGGSAADPREILAALRPLCPRADLMLTLGKQGSVFLACGRENMICQEAVDVLPVIDTTGAGDTFTGYFLAGWMAGEDTATVMKRASTASGIAVGRKGAAASIPTPEEVLAARPL